jgi:amino acid transporter
MNKNLGLKELIAIAIGGMVGGGIFTILGISVAMVGFLAPFAIALGGVMAFFAAYAYVKLGIYYKDEGATYAFFKKTFKNSPLAASFIGWYTVFGYISTLALYAFTFSAYILSGSYYAQNDLIRKALAVLIIFIFAFINLWSVKKMGKLEDIIVYSKVIILFIISVMLILKNNIDFHTFIHTLSKDFGNNSILSILTVSSVTFVAYEGFQLVINALKDMENPDINIKKAIYSAIFIVTFLYFIIALSAVLSIPLEDLIKNKEYALAAGAKNILGDLGKDLVIFGAILATTSAINGTIYGSSRQMARVADDGYLPKFLRKRKQTIPSNAIITMSITASILVLSGGLRVILEFGSITFLLVSLLMAIANFKIRKYTNSSLIMGIISIIGLSSGSILILLFEYKENFQQMMFIVVLYILLTLGAYSYAKLKG